MVGGESRIFTRAISEINAMVGAYRRDAGRCDACCNRHPSLPRLAATTSYPQRHIINISARWSISSSQTVLLQYLCFLFVYQSNPHQHISLKFLISCDTCNDFQESSNVKRLISYFVCNHIALV